MIQELAWRDYWQQIWIAKGDDITIDLKNKQLPVAHLQVPAAVVNMTTGIEAVDAAIKELYETGYMHNHMRMYVASICCNVAQAHWLQPARWMYSHLLDGDLASNYLSWQWVAATFSRKKYYANQQNINKYFNTDQKNTFLDVDYHKFEGMPIPEVLKESIPFNTGSPLLKSNRPILEKNKTTLIYNYYNLDAYWHRSKDVQRVFLLEPSFFGKNPVSQKCIDFAIDLSENIDDIKIYVGEFSDLAQQVKKECLVYKEHPTNQHYEGHEEPRDWMFTVKGYFPSFFAFWKRCKKTLKL
ncbi:FAD-binding domain-containing protein [Fulvivirgaceae bacterium BMA12]|uniref:FAD-binding domain-containing protein n=1 Tax=Agaribacillus aureus TaxID=3051825 RepID=A0ABT8LGL7_9BACT|nr:FAD-binding domain-containing protein [Fulvivirgaceae bacterium BMA12]